MTLVGKELSIFIKDDLYMVNTVLKGTATLVITMFYMKDLNKP